MARSFPRPHHHKASGQARVKYLGRHHYLGPWDSEEARQTYDQLKARFAGGGYAPDQTGALTVAELVAAFGRHSQEHYRHADGTPTSEVADFALSVRELLSLHCNTPVDRFGPLALKDVRQSMVDAGLSRKVVNQRVGRIKRIWSWGTENELVPGSASAALRAVRGLQLGRTKAKETTPIGPVSRECIAAAMPFLTRPVAAMVEFQMLTGCRPGEAAQVRACDIDRSGAVWVYRPARHKTAWRGRRREILLGPKAQALVRQWTIADVGAYLFGPKRSRGKRRYAMAAYGRAVWRACAKSHMGTCKACERRKGEKADPWEKRLRACETLAQLEWHPNQIRHLVATEVRAKYGLEAAQVLLGHAKADVTQIYAEVDAEKGADIVRRIG